MEFQHIYIIQTREFIELKRNVYKIGKTCQPIHKRHGQYPKGSLLLFAIPCINCSSLERNIITLFKEKFIQRTDLGTEYFEGELKAMIIEINKLWEISFVLLQSQILKSDTAPTNTIIYSPPDELKNKWKIINNGKQSKPIELLFNNNTEGFVDVDNGFFFQLKKRGIITLDEEYDEKHLQKIQKLSDKHRFNIHIENLTAFIKHININDKILPHSLREITSNNILVNNIIYAYSEKPIKKINKFGEIHVWINNYETNTKQCRVIVSINKLLYDLECLRTVLPYCVEYNTEGEYYFINRDYEYIGYDTKTFPKDSLHDWKREYLFDDSSKPWINIKHLEKYHRRIAKTLNDNKLTICASANANLLGYFHRQSEPERAPGKLKLDGNHFKNIIEENYILDLSDKHTFVKSRDIINYVKGCGLDLTDVKIGRELSKIGLIGFNKRIENKTIKVYSGIKLKS